jgi:hypothetical protein
MTVLATVLLQLDDEIIQQPNPVLEFIQGNLIWGVLLIVVIAAGVALLPRLGVTSLGRCTQCSEKAIYVIGDKPYCSTHGREQIRNSS